MSDHMTLKISAFIIIRVLEAIDTCQPTCDRCIYKTFNICRYIGTKAKKKGTRIFFASDFRFDFASAKKRERKKNWWLKKIELIQQPHQLFTAVCVRQPHKKFSSADFLLLTLLRFFSSHLAEWLESREDVKSGFEWNFLVFKSFDGRVANHISCCRWGRP